MWRRMVLAAFITTALISSLAASENSSHFDHLSLRDASHVECAGGVVEGCIVGGIYPGAYDINFGIKGCLSSCFHLKKRSIFNAANNHGSIRPVVLAQVGQSFAVRFWRITSVREQVVRNNSPRLRILKSFTNVLLSIWPTQGVLTNNNSGLRRDESGSMSNVFQDVLKDEGWPIVFNLETDEFNALNRDPRPLFGPHLDQLTSKNYSRNDCSGCSYERDNRSRSNERYSYLFALSAAVFLGLAMAPIGVYFIFYRDKTLLLGLALEILGGTALVISISLIIGIIITYGI